MKIMKYKKGRKGQYKLELANGQELFLYEEVILKYELLLRGYINECDMSLIASDNKEWDVYYASLSSLKSRFKSSYDIKELLLKKMFEEELIDKVILKLVSQGYLNDSLFARSYINNQIVTTMKGPKKIERELERHHVDWAIIKEEIQSYDQELQRERIDKVIQKSLKCNRKLGGAVLKKKITNDLVKLGYDSLLVEEVFLDVDIPDCSLIASLEYEKLRKRLERRYEGAELERKIKEKLYQKGLSYEN